MVMAVCKPFFNVGLRVPENVDKAPAYSIGRTSVLRIRKYGVAIDWQLVRVVADIIYRTKMLLNKSHR
jgi:hypothetical protein